MKAVSLPSLQSLLGCIGSYENGVYALYKTGETALLALRRETIVPYVKSKITESYRIQNSQNCMMKWY